MNIDGFINSESLLNEDRLQILICPFCMKEIPIISFSISEDIIYLHINCACVKGLKTIQLEKYFDIFQSSLNKNVPCNYVSSHYDQVALLYCCKCRKWLCSECLISHKDKANSTHVLLPKEVHFCCQSHQASYSYYCRNCEFNICDKCKEGHLDHQLTKIKNITNKAFVMSCKDIQGIIDKNKKLKDDMIKVIENRIRELNRWKNEIEQLYEQNRKMNNLFNKLIDLILKTGKISPDCSNYFFDHIYENFIINKEIVTIGQQSIEESYILVKNHFLNDFVITKNDNVHPANDDSEENQIRNQEYVQSKLIATLEGHTNSVKCLIQLTDGKIASSSWDYTIKLWDLSSMHLVSTLQGHTYYVWSIIQLKDGRLASCSGDNTIRIWDLSLFMCMNTITGDSFCFMIQLKDGRLATCSKETIRLWDIEMFECLQEVNAHSKAIWGIIELNDGRLMSCSWDCSISFWETSSLQCIKTIKEHTESVNYIIQLKDQRVATCSDDKTIRLWDVNSFKYLNSFNGHRDWIFCIKQLKDTRLVSSSNDKSIRFWDIITCQCLDIIQQNDSVELSLNQLQDDRLISGSGDWLNNKTDAVIKIWKI